MYEKRKNKFIEYKGENFSSFKASLEREKKLSEMKSDPVKEEKEIKIKETVKKSKENISNNIFSEELNNKFKSLEIAIEAEEEKLKTLYGIEKELSNITVVVNAGKDVIRDIEEKKKLASITVEANGGVKILGNSQVKKN